MPRFDVDQGSSFPVKLMGTSSVLPPLHDCQKMDSAELIQRLQVIFQDVLDIDIELTPSLSARDVSEWDSLAHVRIIVTVERNFKVKFAAAEVNSLKNVGELIDLIQKHLAKN